jgi:glycine/D-amino acid oxidase-like deaminating enzyme
MARSGVNGWDVVVVGAGMVGSAAARHLQTELGWSARKASHNPFGWGLQQSEQSSLEEAGCSAEIVDCASGAC